VRLRIRPTARERTAPVLPQPALANRCPWA